VCLFDAQSTVKISDLISMEVAMKNASLFVSMPMLVLLSACVGMPQTYPPLAVPAPQPSIVINNNITTPAPMINNNSQPNNVLPSNNNLLPQSMPQYSAPVVVPAAEQQSPPAPDLVSEEESGDWAQLPPPVEIIPPPDQVLPPPVIPARIRPVSNPPSVLYPRVVRNGMVFTYIPGRGYVPVAWQAPHRLLPVPRPGNFRLAY